MALNYVFSTIKSLAAAKPGRPDFVSSLRHSDRPPAKPEPIRKAA